MSDQQHDSRRFNDREISQILKRAAELQQADAGDPSRASGLSLADLQQVAGEAGIDPALVRRAVADLDTSERPQRESAFVGAPTVLQFERVIDGEVPESEYEILVDEIRRTFGLTGMVSTLGRSLAWSSAPSKGELRSVNVSVIPRNGVTTIRVDEHLGAAAGGIFGATLTLSGAGGLLTAIVASKAAAAFAVGGPIGFGIVCLSYFGARVGYQALVTKRSRELLQLLERLTNYASSACGRQSPQSMIRP